MDFRALLERSSASPAFKSDVLTLAAGGRPADAVSWSMGSPPTKVLRVLAQLVDAHPELAIERVRIDGWSGCSDYQGRARVTTRDGEREFQFVWCCRWRAEQEGLVDWFGNPDQTRAAMKFGYRCFREWRLVE